MIFNNIMEEVAQHAESALPLEACGLILHDFNGYSYMPCTNVADRPTEDFAISAEDYLLSYTKGKIFAVVHSHPRGTCAPSLYDRAACNSAKLPYVILGMLDNSLYTLYPEDTGDRAYTGRPFIFGIDDCYTLIQDYYKRELGISLHNYYREDQFWKLGKNYYMERFPEQGFVEVSEPQKHDIILIQISADVPNHGALYLGDGKLLHHLGNRLSSTDSYEGYWRRHTYTTIRHRTL